MIYDLDKNEKILDISNDSKYFYSLAWIDNSTIALGNSNGSINIFNKESAKRIHRIEEHCLPVRSLYSDGINKRLLSASDDLHINVIDIEKYKVLFPLVGHKDLISSIAYNDKKGVYATGSHDGTVKIWDVKQLKCVQTIKIANEINTDCGIIWDTTFSNDGNFIITGSEAGFQVLSL